MIQLRRLFLTCSRYILIEFFFSLYLWRKNSKLCYLCKITSGFNNRPDNVAIHGKFFFFAENMFSLFFPQKYVGTQSFGSRSIFCPLTSKISFFAKNFENQIIFSFFCWTREQKPASKCLNNCWWNWNEKKNPQNISRKETSLTGASS